MSTFINSGGALAITDTHGEIVDGVDTTEPNPGSVVLTQGEYGTAWQRFFSDGKWHPVRGGGSRTWTQLLRRRNLVLVYDAPVRHDAAGQEGA